MKRIFGYVFLMFFALGLRAGSLTVSHTGGSPVATATFGIQWGNPYFESPNWKVSYSLAISISGGNSSFGAYGRIVNLSSGPTVQLTNSPVSGIVNLPNPTGQENGNNYWDLPWAIGTNGWGENGGSFRIGAEVIYKIKIKLPINQSSQPVTYKLMQDGVAFEEITLLPGQGFAGEKTVPGPGPVDILKYIDGLSGDGSAWVVVEGAQTFLGTAKTGISPTISPAVPPEQDLTGGTSGGGDGVATPGVGVGGGTVGTDDKGIWKQDTTAESGEGLTNATYRQGVDKIVEAVKKSSGTATDVSGIESRLDEIKADGRVAGEIADKAFDTTTDKALTPTKAQALTALGLLPDAPSIVAPSSFNGVLSVPLAFPGISTQTMTVHLDEFSTGIDVFKFIVRGALSIWFFFMAVRAVKQAFA